MHCSSAKPESSTISGFVLLFIGIRNRQIKAWKRMAIACRNRLWRAFDLSSAHKSVQVPAYTILEKIDQAARRQKTLLQKKSTSYIWDPLCIPWLSLLTVVHLKSFLHGVCFGSDGGCFADDIGEGMVCSRCANRNDWCMVTDNIRSAWSVIL